MARVAVAAGITGMVATPHVREDFPDVDAAAIAAGVSAAQAQLGAAGIPLAVVGGAEVALGPALALGDAELRALTLGGHGTLLLETPHGAMPSIFEDAVAGLMERGFRILLAHPELSPDLQRDPDRLEGLVGQGALVQLTADSLASGRGRHRQLARTALDRGWAHVVASDSPSASWRPPDLNPAREATGDLFPWLTQHVPRALLIGAPVPERPHAALPAARRSRWLAWRG